MKLRNCPFAFPGGAHLKSQHLGGSGQGASPELRSSTPTRPHSDSGTCLKKRKSPFWSLIACLIYILFKCETKSHRNIKPEVPLKKILPH